MTFTPFVPNTGQSLGQTKFPIQNNFTNYNNLVSVDHVAPNAPNQGQHLQVSLNNFGSFPYPTASNQSYIGSFNASSEGSQLVYQPSIQPSATTPLLNYIPVSPRSLARIGWTGAGNVYDLTNGPYGAGTNFNAKTPGVIASGEFTYKFTQPLTSIDYFIVVTFENVSGSLFKYNITNKMVGSFDFSSPNIQTVGTFVTFMVY